MKVTNYIHPNLFSVKEINGRVLNLKTMDFESPFPIGVPDIVEVSNDLNDYLRRLGDMEKIRAALCIPRMSYCAFSFPQYNYDIPGVIALIEWARHRYETRWWINPMSARLLICIADPELGENAGWEYYMQGKHLPDESFHMPAWWEFCQHGLQIPENWELRPSVSGFLIAATSPDKNYGMIIGGL